MKPRTTTRVAGQQLSLSLSTSRERERATKTFFRKHHGSNGRRVTLFLSIGEFPHHPSTPTRTDHIGAGQKRGKETRRRGSTTLPRDGNAAETRRKRDGNAAATEIVL